MCVCFVFVVVIVDDDDDGVYWLIGEFGKWRTRRLGRGRYGCVCEGVLGRM